MRVAFRDHRGKYGTTWDGATLVFDRTAIGEGEIFEMIVLDAPEPKPDPGPPPPVEPPPGPVPEMTAAYVRAIKAQLEAEGVDLSGPQGAFQITKRVAWGLRAFGVGLVHKPNGNQWDGYSVDYVCFRSGDGVDILGDAGGRNDGQWVFKPNEFAGTDRWRAPVAP